MARADELAKQYPQLKTIDRAVTDARKQMRRNMPALDGWLLKFGYTTTPENKMLQNKAKATTLVFFITYKRFFSSPTIPNL